MDAKPSTSEDNGIATLSDKDLVIYSVGISTGGVAEVRMAKQNPKRHIIATTIDQEGVAFAKENIAKLGLSDRIEVKTEDVSKPLPYNNDYFDFVYARLVLHYLPKQLLEEALAELHRVLKTGGRMFVVVRSVECDDAKAPDATYDPETRLTSRIKKDHTTTRYFHSEESITGHLKDAGFTIEYSKPYHEQLYKDFKRTQISDTVDHVIEVLAKK